MINTKITLLITAFIIGLLSSCSTEEEKIQDQPQEGTNETTERNLGGGQSSVAAAEGEDMNTLQLALSMDDFGV